MSTFRPETVFCIDLAKKVGEVMRRAFATQKVTWKSDSSPLTKADVAINRMVINETKKHFSGYGIWGEEESFYQDAPRRFLVDPIDGTMPFVIGAPLSSFTIAYVEGSEVLGGVVYDPFMDRLYVAERGIGAFCNQQPLKVSTRINTANMFVYLGSRVATQQRSLGMVIDALVAKGIRTHAFNSSAYGLSRVAAGGSDGLMTTADPYGIATANLLLHEAGGVSSTFVGEPWNISLDKRLGYVGASSEYTLKVLLEAVSGSTDSRR